MLESQRSWEDCFTSWEESTRRPEWLTKEEVAKRVKVASDGLGSWMVRWRREKGR